MAVQDPESYGWLAAAFLGLLQVLYIAVKKLTNGKDPLAGSLRNDVDKLDKHVEQLRVLVGELSSDMKVIKFKLGLKDGD